MRSAIIPSGRTSRQESDTNRIRERVGVGGCLLTILGLIHQYCLPISCPAQRTTNASNAQRLITPERVDRSRPVAMNWGVVEQRGRGAEGLESDVRYQISNIVFKYVSTKDRMTIMIRRQCPIASHPTLSLSCVHLLFCPFFTATLIRVHSNRRRFEGNHQHCH